MKIAILGFGREGKSLFKYLKSRGPTRMEPRLRRPRTLSAVARYGGRRRINADENETWVLDENAKTKVPAGVKSRLGGKYLSNLSGFDWIFRSPGIPYNLPQLKKARRDGTKISSAVKLFFEAADRKGAKIIGITGSKGKTTTATLIYKILKAAGFRVFLAGNVGTSALDILQRLDKKSLVVLELSSFQLQDMDVSPHIAVLLDIFPEHQDAHGSLNEYYAAKGNITRHQKRNDVVFYLPPNPISSKLAHLGRGKKIPVFTPKPLFAKSWGLKIPGEHNFKNAAVAAAVAEYLKIPPKIIFRTLANFRGVEHRLELIRKISLKSAYIHFYNDSASTNPHTTAAAIQAFGDKPVVLLAGGYDKGLSYKPVAEALCRSSVKLVVLYGANRQKIAHTIRPAGVPIKMVRNIVSAVKTAYRYAKSYKLKAKSWVILLSPGAASFDQFQNYTERGRIFKKLVKKLRAR
ncbi:MAG: UDP-N-acetylmuramoyl-L-alanine--D-glutamate ligase [Patescibacteria group bacterium]|mgnify:FL=1